MWKLKLKHLGLVLVIIILGLNLFTCDEDLDIDLEDDMDNSSKEHIRSPIYSAEDEEFDNPHLLQENMNSKPDPRRMSQMPPNMPPTMGQNIENTSEPEKRFQFALYEIVMLLFLISFILNCFLGKAKNENLANKWFTANRQYLEENYAHIGVNTEYNTKGSVPMMKESYNNFKFYASGRKFIKWLLVNMDFKKRQDLVTLCTSLFLFSEKDRLVYEVSIIPPQDLPLVFCLCKKKDVKTIKKNYSDVDFFTKPYYPSFLSNNLVLLSEDLEAFENIFNDKEFVGLFDKVQEYIDIIYLTDRQSFSRESHAIFFSFDLVGSPDESVFENLTLFVHQFVDLIATTKISSSYKKDSEKKRIEFDKIRAKELQERNAEEMRQKKVDKLSSQNNKNLTVEQAQKLEEKNKREALKEQKKKQFKIVKK